MKKISTVLLAVILLAAGMTFVLATFPAAAGSSSEYRFPSEIINDSVRIQILSPTVVRLEQKGPVGFEDRATFHIPDRSGWEGAVATRIDTPQLVTLHTDELEISIPADAFDLSEILIRDRSGNILWKYKGLPGSKVFLPAPGADVVSWEFSDTPRMAVPEWGFTPQPPENTQLRETNGFDQGNDAPDLYVLLPGGDGGRLRTDFVKLTGRSEMLPLSSFGAWDSRYFTYTEESALLQIQDYRETYDVPLDNLVIDTDWRKAGTGGIGYDVNTECFPDLEGFIQKAHDRDVSIIFNDHPEPTRNESGQKNSVIIPQEVDYRFENLTRILKMGVDTWWYDRNWSTTIAAPAGFTHEAIGGAVYTDAQKAVYPDRRPFVMSNVDGSSNGTAVSAPSVAQHRYGITWTGDVIGHQEALARELEFTVQYGALGGLPYISTDLGSHVIHTEDMTEEEYVKWMQYGALSPIYRPHSGAAYGRMPWLKGSEALSVIRDYVKMRYRLLPVFYQLSHENYETGIPLLRRLDFQYPDYESAVRNDQYLIGEDILVAPTLTEEDSIESPVPSSWLTAPNGRPGLQAEYFNNPALKGMPAVTKNVDSIDFEWSENAPTNGVNPDKFSIRFTGTLTAGEQDFKLKLNSNDGARVYVDDRLILDSWNSVPGTELTSDEVLEANKSYQLRVEYLDRAGDAFCKLEWVPQGKKPESFSTRSVWIPEGEWIDVFTGKVEYGPRSIEVTVPLKVTPIFVKRGAVIPLADDMQSTREKDWSHVTLDLYPSTRQNDSSVLYEDDTESVKYKKGEYRTTELAASFEDGRTKLQISPANGSFSGPKCFENRDWSLRIHQPPGWGSLQSVRLNGQELDVAALAQDAAAMPFEVAGGSPDGTVYEIHFTGSVYEAQALEIQFEHPLDPQIPELDFDPKLGYRAPLRPVERSITVTEEIPYIVNLTTLGNLDWIHPALNYTSEVDRKNTTKPQISYLRYYAQDPGAFNDYAVAFRHSDGFPNQDAEETRTGHVNKNKGAGFEIQVRAEEKSKRLILFIGGYDSEGTLEIFDNSGNTQTDTYTFSAAGRSFYRMVTIDLTSATGSTLTARYTKTGDTGNITFAAAALGNSDSGGQGQTDSAVERDVQVLDSIPEACDLTSEGGLDWIHLGQALTTDSNRKADVDELLRLTSSAELGKFNDHKTAFGWSDGTPDRATEGITTGSQINRLGASYDLAAASGPEERVLTLYLGGWKSKGKLTVYDESGVTENQVYEFGNLETNFYKTVKIKFKAKQNCNLRVRYELEEQSGSGNITFVAATLYATEGFQVRSVQGNTAVIYAPASQDAVVIAAVYREEAFIDMQETPVKLEKGLNTIELNLPDRTDSDQMKILLWGSLDSLHPLCEAFTG